MTFLFWNIKANPIQDLIAALAHEHQVDVLILAECRIDIVTLLQILNTNRRRHYRLALNYVANERIRIFSTLPRNSFQPLFDGAHYTIHALRPPIGEEILLVAAHLSSKLYLADEDQAFLATRIPPTIRRIEAKRGHAKTLVLGDLNMNPFEKGLVSSEAFHAVTTRDVALKESRRVSGEDRFFFYNPMWGHFGDHTPGPAGTYYNSGKPTSYFWNIFDQVLLRPALLPHFDNKDLQILTTAGETSLLTTGGLPNSSLASDHLPILFKLAI